MSDLEKGNMHASLLSRTASPHRKLANPGPLGLFGFATTTLILSLFNVKADNITIPNAVVGMALFYGGLAQFLAGMWEFACGNTFGATAFTSYGAFWLSFATFFIPATGVADAYSKAPDQEHQALGIYLMAWMTVTFLFFVASLRKSVAFIVLFGFLTATFMCLGSAELSGNAHLGTAGGTLGIFTALIAYYVGTSELLGPGDIISLPLGHFTIRADEI